MPICFVGPLEANRQIEQ